MSLKSRASSRSPSTAATASSPSATSPSPPFLAFSLLHTLGDTRLPVDSKNVLATRRSDGTLVLALWNLVEPAAPDTVDPAGPDKTITIQLSHLHPGAKATIRRVDAQHGDTYKAWKQMGSPAYPTLAQIEQLKQVGTLEAAEPVALEAKPVDRQTLRRCARGGRAALITFPPPGPRFVATPSVYYALSPNASLPDQRFLR